MSSRKQNNSGSRKRKSSTTSAPNQSAYEKLEDRQMLAGDVAIPNLGYGLNQVVEEYQAFQTAPAGQLELTNESDFYISNEKIFVEVRTSANEFNRVRNSLAESGFEESSLAPNHGILEGYLPISELTAIASLPEDLSILPIWNVDQTNAAGAVANDAEATQFTNFLSGLRDLDGTGITIGVISDSADRLGGGIAASQATLDLPAAPQVQVAIAGPAGASDEGRAMMELVHDIAPGANLVFASGVGGDAGMANAINTLVGAGADIIVDDLAGVFSEPFFQDGLASQAIENAVAAGVTYFSSTGNNGNDGYNSATRFEAATVAGIAGQWHDFNQGNDYTQTITVTNTSAATRFLFQFDQAWGAIAGNVDVFLLNPAGAIVSSGVLDNTATGTSQEFLNVPGPGTYQVAVRLTAGTAPTRFHWGTWRGPLTVDEHQNAPGAVVTGTDQAHNGALNSISVAAAFYQTPTVPEGFTGVGPVIRTLSNAGVQIPIQVREKPTITGIDGVNNSFFGNDADGDGNPNFFGTSASAPNVAAMAALLLQQNPLLTPAQIRTSLIAGATDMLTPGYDRTTGFGLVQAVNSSLFISGGVLTVPGNRAGATINDAFVVNRNPMDPANFFDVTLNGTLLGTVQTSLVNNLVLTGLSGTDTFTFNDDITSLLPAITISGGLGNDSLVINNGLTNNFLINGLDIGTVDANIAFSSVENLTGGSDSDRFEFTAAGSLSGIVDGAGGSDTVAGPDLNRTWNLTGFESGNVPASGISFVDIETVESGSARDSYIVSSGQIAISIFDTGGNDTIYGPDFSRTWEISGPDSGNLSFSEIDWDGVESLTGGTASDRFMFTGSGSQAGYVNGRGGYDNLDYSARSTAADVQIIVEGVTGFIGRESSIGQTWRSIEHLIGSTSSITDKITGINADSMWNYTSGVSTYQATSSPSEFRFEKVEQLIGNDQDDYFLVAPPVDARIIVNGGEPTTQPGDTLELDFTGVDNTNWIYTGPGDGTFTFSNRENVIYRSIETLNIFDYGDADSSFGTVESDDGARHRLGTPIRFGTRLDPEADGQPSPLADGDDLNGTNNDEDGVILPGVLIPHFRAAALVKASHAAKLDAWIDLNGDGIFSVTEKIADSVDMIAGTNRIEFVVPYGTTLPGETTARFRISSAGGLSPTGLAENGEIEDHTIMVADIPEGTYAVLPDPLSPGNPANMILVMAGTSSRDDVIVVNPTSSGDLRVRINGMAVGPDVSEPIHRVGSYGLEGDDTIIVTSTMSQQSELYGDMGDDELYGGASADYLRGGSGDDNLYGHEGRDLMFGEDDDDFLFGHGGSDILSGNSGNDRLFGGGGADLLFGGSGADWLYGQGGQDLLIGNSSVFDNIDAALELFRNEWTSKRDYSVKLDNINNGTGMILAGSGLTLNSGTSVTDDGEYDRYFGGRGRDGYISLFGSDTLFSPESNEDVR